MRKGMKQQKRLPEEGVDAPSPELFKVKLDRALKCQNLLKMFLLTEGGLDLTFKGPFHSIL